MKILCPHCGVKGSADDSYHGQKVKCPKCQGIFAALPDLAVVPQEEPAPATLLVEEPVERDALISRVQKGDAEPMDDEAHVLADDTLTDDIVSSVEEKEENDLSEVEASIKSDAALDGVLPWSDITSEIDREMEEDTKRDKEKAGDSAALNDFFEDVAPAIEEPVAAVQEQQIEKSVEAIPPMIDGVVPAEIAVAPIAADLPEAGATEKDDLDGVERQPYGMEKEQCWQCGKKDSVGVPFIAKDGRLYCPDCVPAEKPVGDAGDSANACFVPEGTENTADSPRQVKYSFTVGGLLKEAWAKTKGAKATVWAGSAVMYLALLVLGAAGAFLMPSQQNGYGGAGLTGLLGDALFPLITNVVSSIFSAGLIYIGIRKVAGDDIFWKMVFEGFSVAGKLIVATLLQTLLIFIGFLLLILPGIYLAVGYAMTSALIVDRKMSPWQAMETSRKAIHGVWWKIFGLSLVMGLIFLISMIPLGIGLVWTWPMFVILGGVVYRSLFGIEKRLG